MYLTIFDFLRLGRLGSSRFQNARRIPDGIVFASDTRCLAIKTEPNVTNVYAHSTARLSQMFGHVDVLRSPPLRAAIFESVVFDLFRFP